MGAEDFRVISGAELFQKMSGKWHRAVTTYKDNLLRLERIERVFVVGPSGSGKTTLVNGLRAALMEDPDLAARVAIPLRAVSRERVNDDDRENTPMEFGDFDKALLLGEIGMFWERYMEYPSSDLIEEFGYPDALWKVRKERYGFLPADGGKLPVYSANNAIITNAGSLKPGDVLDNALIIAVDPKFDDERVKGLIARSPDLLERPYEPLARKWDWYFNVFGKGHDPHIGVLNYGESRRHSVSEFIAVVRAAANIGS